MATGARSRSSILGALLLIGLGALFLYANLEPSFNPWPFVARFWPVLIILWGLSKLLNYVRARRDPALARASRTTGGEVCLLVVVILIGLVLSAGVRHHGGMFSVGGPMKTKTESVDLAGAESVRVALQMRAGEHNLTGGADNLMDGEFGYNVREWKPEIDYPVTGEWKCDLDVQIKGGVGRLTVHLPREVEVEVEVSARGGIGAVHAHGLDRRGRAYVNDAFGKSDVTVRVDVRGGIGEINLEAD